MKLSTYASITAIVAVLYGLALLLIPIKFAGHYGITLDSGGKIMARLAGSSLCGQAVLFWVNRNIPGSEKSWYGIWVSSVLFNIINALVAVRALMNGTVNALGWTTVIISLLFAFGSGYFAFKKSA